MFWRYFNLALTFAMMALWAWATLAGFIGSTTFIGHVSMFALVLAAWASYRSDTPTKTKGKEEDATSK